MARLKKGDRVRVREWDDMANEFGLNEFGDIETEYIFIHAMANLCGKSATVIDILSDDFVQTIRIKPDDKYINDEDDELDWVWMFTNEMFEIVE